MRDPFELACGKRVLGAFGQHKLNGVRAVNVVALVVDGGRVHREIELVGRRRDGAEDADDVDEMVLAQHDCERWLSLAVLVAENELGHERELVGGVVGHPIVNAVFNRIFFDAVPTVAEVEGRSGVEAEGVSHALDECSHAWKRVGVRRMVCVRRKGILYLGPA